MNEFVRLRVKIVGNNTSGAVQQGRNPLPNGSEREPSLALLPDLLEHLTGQCHQPCERIAWRTTTDHRVETEAAASRIDRELHVHDREKHIIPRPFGGMCSE